MTEKNKHFDEDLDIPLRPMQHSEQRNLRAV